MLRFVGCLLAAISLQAATPLYQVSFENPNSGWTVVHGSAAPDSAVTHSGDKALRLESEKASADACVRSAPLSLTIGKRYELSGRSEERRVGKEGRSRWAP